MTGRAGALRRAVRMLREMLLTLAALGGAACIVLTVLAFTGGYSLIMFKTGSMSPTIPAGSVALVQSIPASEIEVGDVVTVDRAAALPITHRVTTVSDAPSPQERVITMRGDANQTDDPLPYSVSEVRIVRGSVPHLASAIVWFGSPAVLAALTVGAAALVTWAFWPRHSPGQRRDVPPAAAATAGTRRSRRTAGVRTSALLLVAGMTAAAAVSAPAPAEAADLLSIRSSAHPGVTVLDPHRPYHWDVEVDARAAPREGELTVELRGSGDPRMRLVAEVRSCDAAWQRDGCPHGERLLRSASVVRLDDVGRLILRSPTPDVANMRLSLTATAGDAAEARATLTLRAVAAQQDAETRLGGTPLPATGGSGGLLAAPAAVLIGLGAALVARTRRRGPKP